MYSFISRLFTRFSQFIKLGEKNAHDNSDSYSPVPNPGNSNSSATSYFSRIISILRHTPSLLMQNSPSSNLSPETNQSDHVSIPVEDHIPAITTAADLMDIINELSIILTSQHDISKLEWAYSKFMNQNHCGPFLDNVSVAILLLHYGIEQDSNGIYVNKKNRDVGTLQQAINHMLLLAITTDDNEINLPETTPFYKSGTSPKIISSAENIRINLDMFTWTLVDEMIRIVPEVGDLVNDEIPMLARAATICFILSKRKSTTIIKKLLEIRPCIYSHFTLVTILVVKNKYINFDPIHDTLPDIFLHVDASPQTLINLLESITGYSVVPRNAQQCMFYNDVVGSKSLSFCYRRSLANFTQRRFSSLGDSDTQGLWTINPHDENRLYFRSLRCDASKPCPLRCNEVFDYMNSVDVGDTTDAQQSQEQQKQPVLVHPSCTSLMVPEMYAHRLLRRGKFELRFDWRILVIFSCMAAVIIGLIAGQNIISQFTLSIDIRPALNVLIAVFTGLASVLNNLYWPDTTFHDFVSCRRAIVNFSDATSAKRICVGCQTAALLESRESVSKSAAGPYVNLIGQPSSSSKEDGMLIDRPGTTSCLHRAGFYFIEAFSLISYPCCGKPDIDPKFENAVNRDVVKYNVRTYTIEPCKVLLGSANNIRDNIYSAKYGKSLLGRVVNDGYCIAIIAVVNVGLREYGRLTWLEKPVIVYTRSTPYIPVHLIG
ncbi:hypothetical protein GQ42DRAFT_92342 [Ramicandelaber brevisporus]|nr:hypothetical protein GQ42DRAFT_92342 [Ramicandelaber brevisporus]